MNFNSFCKSIFSFSGTKIRNSANLFISLIALILILLLQSCEQQTFSHQIIHDTVLVDKSKSLIKLFVDSVRVDDHYKYLSGQKMIDGVPAFVNGKETKSRWAVEGYPHYAMFYFDGLVSVTDIKFNLYKGDEGFTNHIKIYNFSDLLWQGDVGDSLWNNIHINFYGTSIFFEISGPAKNIKGITNDWTDIGEIDFYGIN